MKILDANDEIQFKDESIKDFQRALEKIIQQVIKKELKDFEKKVLAREIMKLNSRIDSYHSNVTIE